MRTSWYSVLLRTSKQALSIGLMSVLIYVPQLLILLNCHAAREIVCYRPDHRVSSPPNKILIRLIFHQSIAKLVSWVALTSVSEGDFISSTKFVKQSEPLCRWDSPQHVISDHPEVGSEIPEIWPGMFHVHC